ncbi:MAG: hypothetical protein ACRDSF_26170 [Pseudonocardiaceae bacterium]
MTDSPEPAVHPSPGDDRVEPAALAADKPVAPPAAVRLRRRSARGAPGALISARAVAWFPSTMPATTFVSPGVLALQQAMDNMSRSVTAAISATVPQHFSAFAAVRASTELNLVSKAAADVVRISAGPDYLTRIPPTWAGSTRTSAGMDKLAGLDKLSG